MFFTVFTPTYNRAYILGEAYKSLLEQSYKDFMWLIMDDGSQDDTEDLVNGWQQENKLHIKYFKQENQGRFIAFNNAVKYAEGELFVFLDSDDRLYPNTLSALKNIWDNVDDKSKYSGIISYMTDFNGEINGNKFPDNIYAERTYVLYDKYRLTGDKSGVYRIDLVKKYKYPEYPGEKFGGDSIVMNMMNKEAPMIINRNPLYYREYPEDSITKNLKKHHANSPNGEADYYKQSLELFHHNLIRICKYSIGYVCFSIFSGRRDIVKTSPKKLMTIIAYIPGILYLHFKFGKEYAERKRKLQGGGQN